MSFITQEQREAAYSNAPENVVGFYGSLETARFIKKIREKYFIDDSFINIVGDTILRLMSEDDLKQVLTDLGVTSANILGIELEMKKFLSLSEKEQPVSHDNNARPPQIQQSQPVTSEARPLTREELMQKLSPRRTMVADVASVQHPPVSQPAGTPVQGYEAYQNSKGPGAGR